MKASRPGKWLRTALGSTVGLGILVAIGLVAIGLPHGAAPAAANGSSAFCGSKRTVQIVGGKGQPEFKSGYAAHMEVGPGPIVAGEEVPVKILNEGTDVIKWDGGKIQRWTRDSWRNLPHPRAKGFSPPILIFIPPGAETGCFGPRTGSHWPAGRYRWVLRVKAEADSGLNGRHLLRAVFRVVAPAG